MISSAISCTIAFITSLVNVDMTLVQCSRFTPMGATHIQVDSILTLPLTTQEYTKTQPKLDAFDERFLEFKAVLDLENSIK